jgi:prephenate dehydrogenase
MKHKKKLAIVGMGQFGTFIKPHLEAFFTIVPVRRDTKPELIASCDIVVFAVSFDGLEPTVQRLKKFIAPSALLCDVMSIKQKPLALLNKNFPKNEIIGTHPVFGPQSGKQGIAGLPITICNVSATNKTYKKFSMFLSKQLKLKVIGQSPIEHDAQMASVQALTHFIGRALVFMDIKSYPTNTKSYNHLLELCDLLRYDSLELFKTIQTHNKSAKVIRNKFLKSLKNVEKELG